MKIVMKFGGTSVGNGVNIRHVADLVTQYSKEHKVAVVVSALAGVTNSLIETGCQAQRSDEKHIQAFTASLLKKHTDAITAAITSKTIQKEVTEITEKSIAELEKVLTGICYVGELTPKSKDYVMSFGERLSAPIVCGAIRDFKAQSQCFTGKEAGIVTDSNFGEADPLMNSQHICSGTLRPSNGARNHPSCNRLHSRNQDGIVTTVGRGGSDYTATISASP
jgi:aspartate kinase